MDFYTLIELVGVVAIAAIIIWIIVPKGPQT
jgi:Tfp pilus assembly protein FimT